MDDHAGACGRAPVLAYVRLHHSAVPASCVPYSVVCQPSVATPCCIQPWQRFSTRSNALPPPMQLPLAPYRWREVVALHDVLGCPLDGTRSWQLRGRRVKTCWISYRRSMKRGTSGCMYVCGRRRVQYTVLEQRRVHVRAFTSALVWCAARVLHLPARSRKGARLQADGAGCSQGECRFPRTVHLCQRSSMQVLTHDGV